MNKITVILMSLIIWGCGPKYPDCVLNKWKDGKTHCNKYHMTKPEVK